MATISILNQHIDDEEGIYRIRHGNKVGYLTILADVFNEDTMCRPYLLIPKLPRLPEEEWTRIHISKGSAGETSDASNMVGTNEPLPGVQTIWHSQHIDVLSLDQIKRHRSNVHEVMYNGVPALCKIAAFDWDIPRLERESWAYSFLDQYQRDEPGISQLSPRVLGHITEHGRVMGLLLERLQGDCASLKDLSICADALRRLHGIGLIHGDVNRYNFIIDAPKGQVCMVDFEHAAVLDEAIAKQELESLESELKEETGRGGPTI